MNIFSRTLLIALLAMATLPQLAAAQDERAQLDTPALRKSVESLLDDLDDFKPVGQRSTVRDYQQDREDLKDFVDSGRLNRLSTRDVDDLKDILGELDDDLNQLSDDLDDLADDMDDDEVERIEDRIDELSDNISETLDDIESEQDELEETEEEDVEIAGSDDNLPWWKRHPWFRDRYDEEEDVFADEDELNNNADYERNTDDMDEDESRSRRSYHSQIGWRTDATTFVGDYGYRWPFSETGLYRNVPPIRYNRVDGFVLGIGSDPLNWDDWEMAKVIGQVGYAFGDERWKYQIGAEVRLNPHTDDEYGLKIGGFYQRNTVTNDLWKSNWIENSLAAFFFENDFFDYYEAQGYQLYAVQRLGRMAQISAGFRSEEHHNMLKSTSWSLFGGNDFRSNLPINETDSPIRSIMVALDGGRVRNFHRLPRGYAFHAEGEYADGFDNPFKYNRILGDARAYIRVPQRAVLALRARGGYTTGNVPIQRQFTLGGIGSVRGYWQNAFLGSRMLLGNAEYMVRTNWLADNFLDDVTLIGFFDAGWVNNAGANEFQAEDMLTSAGLGLGFNDRTLRLELAFPLHRVGGMSMEPSLWLRISPSF